MQTSGDTSGDPSLDGPTPNSIEKIKCMFTYDGGDCCSNTVDPTVLFVLYNIIPLIPTAGRG